MHEQKWRSMYLVTKLFFESEKRSKIMKTGYTITHTSIRTRETLSILMCSSKGVSDLEARVDYSYQHARISEHLNFCFPDRNVLLTEKTLYRSVASANSRY